MNIDLTTNTAHGEENFNFLGYQHKGFMHDRINFVYNDGRPNYERIFYESWKEK